MVAVLPDIDGAVPVREFLADLDAQDRAAIRSAMARVQAEGRSLARHLRGDLYEVRVSHPREGVEGSVLGGGASRPRAARAVVVREEDPANA